MSKKTNLIVFGGRNYTVKCPKCSFVIKGKAKEPLVIGKSYKSTCKKCKHVDRCVASHSERKAIRIDVSKISFQAQLVSPFKASINIINLSRDGMKFNLKEKINMRTGGSVQCEVIFPYSDECEVIVEGIIRKADGDQYGIEFTNADRGRKAGKAVGFFLLELANQRR